MNPREKSSYVTEIVVSDSAEGVRYLIDNADKFIVVRENDSFVEIQSRKDKINEFFGGANPYVDVRAEFKPICDFDEQESDVDIHEPKKSTLRDFS